MFINKDQAFSLARLFDSVAAVILHCCQIQGGNNATDSRHDSVIQ